MTPLSEFYIARCLQLAQLGQGRTHPNPMVGCVVLDSEGRVVGEGYHQQYGGPHAEVHALQQAGERAKGGTLYVSLEPCSHTGKTPPCSQAVIDSGVSTVVCGMLDPNPQVAGTGRQALQAHGIQVTCGVLEEACRTLNEAFCHAIQTQRPFVVLKQAMTLDGRIATRSGQSQWISGSMARQWVHQLRAQSDGILTTAQSVLADDSRLTVRDAPLLGAPPVRIVLDRHLRLDPERYTLFSPTAQGGPVWILTRSGHAQHPNAQKIQAAGGRVFEVEENGQGLCLEQVMAVLGREGMTQLLVEAGSHFSGALLEAGLVNKLWLVYGNKLLLDPAALPGFHGDVRLRLSDALPCQIRNSFVLGDSVVVEAYPSP